MPLWVLICQTESQIACVSNCSMSGNFVCNVGRAGGGALKLPGARAPAPRNYNRRCFRVPHCDHEMTVKENCPRTRSVVTEPVFRVHKKYFSLFVSSYGVEDNENGVINRKKF